MGSATWLLGRELRKGSEFGSVFQAGPLPDLREGDFNLSKTETAKWNNRNPSIAVLWFQKKDASFR